MSARGDILCISMAGEQLDAQTELTLVEPVDDFITRLENDLHGLEWTLHSAYTFRAIGSAATEIALDGADTEVTVDDKPEEPQPRVVNPIRYLDEPGELTFRSLQELYGPTNVRKHRSDDEREVALFVNSACIETAPTEIAS